MQLHMRIQFGQALHGSLSDKLGMRSFKVFKHFRNNLFLGFPVGYITIMPDECICV